ncbi:acyl-CoA reductase [Aureibacter tunicatorum]|uniref:Acyl-CoA reductase n=1 Tax=Aureibacter tunicatorum TaxID=866807 RepID=A0AAE4BRZ7_9BACT|nr:acyl-CoA reductase [Aureibacter tunicatorum]MDR6238378.1 hypothetical protein [Aureibacter tunicatorum]BDD03410.1 acyl-CoA reductase [Aureibacter tunicatorum]
MTLDKKIETFAALGTCLKNLTDLELEIWQSQAYARNNWFTPENVKKSIDGIIHMLQKEKLEQWTKKYPELSKEKKSIKVGVVMAGNIPAVGFHDLLSILISGHTLLAKLSSQDEVLLKKIADILIEIAPEFKEKINFVERLNEAEAIIATGSDNSARYFEYYFKNKPHIIRPNKSSLAILTGEESKEELQELGNDIFTYFGLGCRNVSKLLVPSDYNFTTLLDQFEGFSSITNNHKYSNNYDYNKSIYLVNKVEHYDNGFLIVTKNESLVSPISVLYYDTYDNKSDLEDKINQYEDKIQCIAGQNFIPFGNTQLPELWDYADGIDTLDFLIHLG